MIEYLESALGVAQWLNLMERENKLLILIL